MVRVPYVQGIIGRYLHPDRTRRSAASAPTSSTSATDGSSSSGSESRAILSRRHASGDVEMQVFPRGTESHDGETGQRLVGDVELGNSGAGRRGPGAGERGHGTGARVRGGNQNVAVAAGGAAQENLWNAVVGTAAVSKLKTLAFKMAAFLKPRASSDGGGGVLPRARNSAADANGGGGGDNTNAADGDNANPAVGDNGPDDDADPMTAKDWRESVEKALSNPMNVSRLGYFGSMTLCLTVLFARRRDVTSTHRDLALMGLEMSFCFSIVTGWLFNLLSNHTVQTTAPRITRRYECSNSSILWLFTVDSMFIYTTRIPHEVFCWWMWIIMGFFAALAGMITFWVGCMGGVKEGDMIYPKRVGGSGRRR